MAFVCAKLLLAPSIQAKKKEPFHSRSCDWEFHRSKRGAQEQVNRRQWHRRALLANAAFSTSRMFTACPLNSNFPLQLSPPSARHPRSRVNDSTTKMPGEEEEEEGIVSAGWAVHQDASRDTGSLALLLLAAVPLPPLAVTQTFLSWSTPLPLRFAFELCKLCTPQGFSAKR